MKEFFITLFTNIVFFSWYTRNLSKELDKFEKRLDRKINDHD